MSQLKHASKMNYTNQSPLKAGWFCNPKIGVVSAAPMRTNWKTVLALLMRGGWTWAVGNDTSKYFFTLNCNTWFRTSDLYSSANRGM